MKNLIDKEVNLLIVLGNEKMDFFGLLEYNDELNCYTCRNQEKSYLFVAFEEKDILSFDVEKKEITVEICVSKKKKETRK